MRTKKEDHFLELAVTELDTYALIQALSATIEQEESRQVSEDTPSFLKYAHCLYIKSLKDVLSVIKGAVEQ